MRTKKTFTCTIFAIFFFTLTWSQSTIQMAPGAKIEADESIDIYLNTMGLLSTSSYTIYHDHDYESTKSRASAPFSKLFQLSGDFNHKMWGEFDLHGDYNLFGDLTVSTDNIITSGGAFNTTGGFIFNLDHNENHPNESFLIKNGLGINMFRIQEDGQGFSKNFTTQGNLTVEDSIFSKIGRLSTPENFVVRLDDNNSTTFGPSFIIENSFGQLARFGGFLGSTISENLTINGNLEVTGSISKGGGTFRIDHPLDPENKYLYHSFIESPDMMNIYNGNATTDAEGFVTVQLPDYFEELNMDFRYQLTTIKSFARAMVGEKISDNQFVIQTDTPHVEVSWMVTGIRNDTWAQENRVQVEVKKNP